MAPHAGEDSVTLHEQLVTIFETCTVEADVSDIQKQLCKAYESYNGQGFEESFEHILKISLSEGKRNNEVRRIFSFISELLVTLDNKFKDAKAKESVDEESDDMMHPLMKNVFSLLEQWSQASSYIVRFRSCQFLNCILTYIQDHGIGELAMDTYEALLQVIEARRLDVSCTVRVQAISLAKFFQDPHTINDPIIAGLCWQMQNDPNPLVRKTAVSIVAACEETIIPITKRFLYDKNANVRNAALLHICSRISPRSFTTRQRIIILKQCFTDPSHIVRRNAEQRLIPVWFRAYKDKLTRFFKDLREGNESLDNIFFMPELLQVLAKCVKIAQIVDEIGLDVDSCLPKATLSGEQAFLWRHFYQLAHKDERLSKFIPLPDALIDFILKYFSNSSIEDDQAYVFNELTLFLLDIIETNGADKCEKVFPALLGIMKNPFISYEVMPYIMPLYLNYAPKERETIRKEILEVIEDLLKMLQFTSDDDQAKRIVLKCFAIASQVLIEGNIITKEFQSIKDLLINDFLDSDDLEIKIQAITTLSLYCQMDIIEAKLSWSLFAECVNIDPSPLKNSLLKGAFDILKCHGCQMFANLTSNGEDIFDEALGNLLLHLEEEDENERTIMVQGILKLFLDHHTYSPIILSQLIALLFHPDEYHSLKKDLEEFFQLYGETKEEAECLSKAFLYVINILFGADENSPFYKVSIKKVALQLIEYSKQFENSKDFKLKDSFKGFLVLKLTKKFLKKPWRLTAADVYAVCNQFLPRNYDNLLKLKEQIGLIIESFDSVIFQRKTPAPKRTLKQFSSYMKKVQVALDTAPQLQEDYIESPIEKRLFTDSYVDAESSKSQTEINSHSSSSSIPSEDPSLAEASSERISPSSSRSESPVHSTENSSMANEFGEESTAETSLPTKTPSKEVSSLNKTSAKEKNLPPSKTPAKCKTPLPSKTPAKDKLITKTPNPLPSKTPVKGKTPLPLITPAKDNVPPSKTPAKFKTPFSTKSSTEVKETPLPSKTPKGKTPLKTKIYVDESD